MAPSSDGQGRLADRLVEACKAGAVEEVQRLHAQGAALDVADSNGHGLLPIHYACGKGHLERRGLWAPNKTACRAGAGLRGINVGYSYHNGGNSLNRDNR